MRCKLSFAVNFMQFLVKIFSACDVIIQTLGFSAGGKTAEKISVTYHFVISAMKAFIYTKLQSIFNQIFHYDVINQTLRASARNKAAEKISVTYHFVISAT